MKRSIITNTGITNTRLLEKYLAQILPLALAVIWFIPLFWMLCTAFTESSTRMSLFPSTSFTLEHIKFVWSTVPFDRYYFNTISIAVCTFSVQFVFITMAAYALAVIRFKGEKLVFAIIFMQIIISNDILIIPNYLTIVDLHLANKKLGAMMPFFGSAFGIFLLRQQFKTIPAELRDAARIDGCNTWNIIWKVYMPNSRAAYIAFGLVSVSYHWNNYLWPMIVLKSVETRPLTVGLAIFAKSKEALMQWSNVCAAAFIVAIPLLLLFIIFQDKFINSFVRAGIK